MRTSETIAQLARALAQAQGELPNVPKETMGQVGNQRRAYADLASVTDICRPVLAKHRLAYVQFPSAGDEGSVTITTRLLHESGEWMEDDLSMSTGNGSPQAVGSAITYGRRYALMAALGLAPDDDDGQAASHQEPAPKSRKGGPTDAQTRKAMALFAELDITDRDARLQVTADILDREVPSWNDLSRVEAGKVIDALEAKHESQHEGQPTLEGD
jgi:hypothetical protein